MGSALHANGVPYARAATEDGKTIERLTRQKHDDYPELLSADRVHFVVLACEEGGRWGPDVFAVIRDLVRLKVAMMMMESVGKNMENKWKIYWGTCDVGN